MVNRFRFQLRQAPWWVAQATLAFVVLLVTWMPVLRMSRNFEINLNEGWNAYRARMADHGIPLYGSPPKFTSTNYPPLSFHLVGFAGRITGDYVAAGRWISLVSIVALAVLTAVFVRKLTDRWNPGIYAALTFVIWLGVFQDNRIGMNDPQLFAMTINLFGLYAYAAHRHSRKWLCVPPCICHQRVHQTQPDCLPTGYWRSPVVHTLMERTGVMDRRAGRERSGSAGAYGDHRRPYFLAHMNLSRPYYIWDFTQKVSNYVTMAQIPIAVALVWSAFHFADARRNLLMSAWICATAVALIFTSGYGVDGNIYFDSFVALTLIVGVAANDVERMLTGKRFAPWILCVTLLAPLIGIVPRLPDRWQRDRNHHRAFPYIEQQFAEIVHFLANRPGPAICHNLLICYEAGKADDFDTFAVACQFGAGKISAVEISNEIDSGRFRTVEFDGDFDRGPADGGPMGPEKLSFKNDYRVTAEYGWYRFGIPKEESPTLK